MNKFTKGALIAAGCFCAGGVILGIAGAVGRAYTDEPTGVEEDFEIVRDTWDKVRGWDLRWRRGGAVRGLTLEYGGIEFDKDHKDNIVYGSFTDDSLQGQTIGNLDVEIGDGKLTICQGDGLKLKKEGGSECQYYMEGDTFYLKQKGTLGGGKADLVLTLPGEATLDEVDIEMAAGEVTAEDVLAARDIEIEIAAGEITMEEAKADSFCANVAAGSVIVHRLDAVECSVEVDMGSITLEDSFIAGDLDAEVSMGEISIFLRDSYENHDYAIDCGMGDVTVSPEDGSLREYGGFGNTMYLYGKSSGGNSTYDLDCSMGSIYVKFAGKDAAWAMAGAVDAADASGAEKGQREDGVPEPPEVPELPEAAEPPELPEVPEIPDVYGIVNEWPDRIGRENVNTTADNFSFEIEAAEPTVFVISCVTERGELDLEIEDDRGKEIFEKDNIRTGEYEVIIKSSGTYRVSFDCEDHTGSFWISPKE